MKNYKLVIQYDGTDYHGWQTQENAVTVQEILSKAISRLLNCPPPDVVGCGRTDSGVHAKKYVCNFRGDTSIPMEKFPLALNAFLPDDIIAIHCEEVSNDFNSSYMAKKKTYSII